jgi:cell wall-associated NlpC family hydrolase
MVGRRFVRWALVAALGLASHACANPGPSREAPEPGRHGASVAAIAAGLVGRPYRYGGATPRGFDCSGLVHYAHLRAGLVVPRTTRSQWRHARRVPPGTLAPGDLLFFDLEGGKVSHVGIYVGGGRFIHAPSAGRTVTEASLRLPYWRDRLKGAGRFH